MSTGYPIDRDDRARTFTVQAGETSWGPFTFKVWDAADVALQALDVATGRWVDIAGAAVTLSGAAPAPFTVTRVGLATGTSCRVIGRRIPERQTNATRGGGISSAALEADLDRGVTEAQELRRDASEAVAISFQAAETARNALATIDDLVAGVIPGGSITVARLASDTLALIASKATSTGIGALLLNDFDTGGNPTIWVADAFQTAAAEEKVLIGGWREGGYRLDGTVPIPSGLQYLGLGATFTRVLGGSGLSEPAKLLNWGTPMFQSAGWLSGYVSDLVLANFWFDDLDGNRDGTFIACKANNVYMPGLRTKKLSPNWNTIFKGNNWNIIAPHCDTYSVVTGAATPAGFQSWADAIHLSAGSSNITITAPVIYAQDDCIAGTINDASWGDMLPDPNLVGRNISIGGGGILKSRVGYWLTMGCDPGNPGNKPAGAAWRNVKFGGGILCIAVNEGDGDAGGGVHINDTRTGAAQHDDIVIDGLMVDAQGAGVGSELFQIVATDGASKNIKALTISNIRHASTGETSAWLGQIKGVEVLTLDGVATKADNLIDAANAMTVENCGVVRMPRFDLRHVATANVLAVAGYNELEMGVGTIGGGAGAPDEFAALSLTPAAGARIKIGDLTLRDSARSIVQTGVHGSVSVGHIEQLNVTFPGLPPDIALAAGEWLSYTPTMTPENGGAYTAYTATGRYRKRAKDTVEVDLVIAVATKGSPPAGLPLVSLPIAAAAGSFYSTLDGWSEFGAGKEIQGRIAPGATVARVATADFADPVANGVTIIINGEYRI